MALLLLVNNQKLSRLKICMFEGLISNFYIPDVQASDRQRRALEGQEQQADRILDRPEARFSRLCQTETYAGEKYAPAS